MRIRSLNDSPIRRDGRYVLYWMTATRRLAWNHALDHAVDLALEAGRPLLVFEPLRCDYPWASPRFHRFVMDGMEEHREALRSAGVAYYPYVEPVVGAGRGLLAALASGATSVVTDDHPGFFLPRMSGAAAAQLGVRLEAVDSCGVLPVRATDRVFSTAYSFRRWSQKVLPEHLARRPGARPLVRAARLGRARIGSDVSRRWKPATAADLRGASFLAGLPLDASVPPVTAARGGRAAARRALAGFVRTKLGRYAEEGNRPDAEATSDLSAWLHFGHLSSHEVFEAVARAEGWSPSSLSDRADGRREGWWGMSPGAEAFLDQLVTWRELGFNAAAHLPAYDHWETLPPWARITLEEHAGDPRPELYTREELERSATRDPLWNAAQRQLVREGRIHNYLRMLWGKKILEWSPGPREALANMLCLNDKYALDGRDPNSISGIFWVLGRYDRPWGPERDIFGKVRYMSSRNTARKLPLKRYLEKYSPGGPETGSIASGPGSRP